MQHSRLEKAGFDWKKGKAAEAGANKAHKDWLASIGAKNTKLNTIDKYLEAKYNDTEEYRLLTGYPTTKGMYTTDRSRTYQRMMPFGMIQVTDRFGTTLLSKPIRMNCHTELTASLRDLRIVKNLQMRLISL